MSTRRTMLAALNTLLGVVDAEVVRKSTLDRLGYRVFFGEPSYNTSNSSLPDGAALYLQPDNARLRELKQHYRAVSAPVTDHSAWHEGHVSATDLQYFRGDNVYVWQYRNWNSEINYLLTAYYIKAIDTFGLLNTLTEDDTFGVHSFSCAGRRISRDLLDSIVEIYFLQDTLRIAEWPSVNVLDIGSGYGRLAYRMAHALPNLGKVCCVDAVPESTFVCEYYLRYRGVENKAMAVPLDEIEHTLATFPADLAINIHSFSECTLSAITWWLDLLRQHHVRYLMIVPHGDNDGQLLSYEKDGSQLDFTPAIESRGYRLAAKRPKYRDPQVQKYGVTPTFHYLFQLADNTTV